MRRVLVAWLWLATLITVNLVAIILLSGSSIADAPLFPFAMVWLLALPAAPLVLRVRQLLPERHEG